VALALLSHTGMDKTQDADLEKGRETIEDATYFFEEDHAPLFDADDDMFESHHEEESEFDYEPDGAFLD
jgi:hypothetical protein